LKNALNVMKIALAVVGPDEVLVAVMGKIEQ
jgi:hypothetical protein